MGDVARHVVIASRVRRRGRKLVHNAFAHANGRRARLGKLYSCWAVLARACTHTWDTIQKMGLQISRVAQSFWDGLAALSAGREVRVLMVGLDAAGKTTILYKLKRNETVLTVPTVGFNLEVIKYRNVEFTVWDIGGQDKIRKLWRYYYENTEAIIFVVDANDRARVDTARDELHAMLAEHELRDAMVLVLANKQDLPHSLKTSEVAEKMGLTSLRGRDWFVQGTCAVDGAGLYEGLDWLAQKMKMRS